MSQFFSVNVRATIDPKSNIQSQLNALALTLKPIDVKIKLNNTEALRTIQTFNAEMQKLQKEAASTGKQLSSAITPDSTKAQAQNKKLQKTVEQVTKAQEKAGKQASTQQNQQVGQLDKITEGWQKVNKEVTKYDKNGKKVTQTWSKPDTTDTLTTVTDDSGNLISHTFTENFEKDNQELLKIGAERERIFEQINKIERTGYASGKQLQTFRDNVENKGTMDSLKGLSREITQYGTSLENLPKKDGLQQTLTSLKTLEKNGSIKPAKGGLIDKLEGQLVNANTKKEIDAVSQSINKFQSTLSNRDKGFLEIEKLRADDVLPQKELSAMRERVRKAQSPEQSKKLLDVEIEQLKARNVEGKKLIAVDKERTSVLDKIQKIESGGYGDSGTLGGFKDEAANRKSVDSLKDLSREVGIYSDSLKNVPKQNQLQESIDSLRTLSEAGVIDLPDDGTLDRLQGDLVNASSTKDIKDVDDALTNLNKTLSSRDKAMVNSEKLRADDFLEMSEIDEIQSRIKQAQSPEDVSIINKDIGALEQKNSALKEQNAINIERESVLDRISKLESDGYGDSEIFGWLKDDASSSDSIGSLKELRKEVDGYGESLKNVPKKADLQESIDSLKTLSEAGVIELPDDSILNTLQGDLVNADTTKDIKDVDKALRGLNKTISDRDKALAETAQLRKDGFDSSLIDEAETKLKGAQTPEGVAIAKQDVTAMKEMNAELKVNAQRAQQAADKQEQLRQSVQRLQNQGRISKSSAQRTGRLINVTDDLEDLKQIDDILKRQNLRAQSSQQTIKSNDNFHDAQEKLRTQLGNLNNQIDISDQKFKELNNSIDSKKNVRELKLMSQELDKMRVSGMADNKATSLNDQALNAQRTFATQLHSLESSLVGKMSPEHTARLREIQSSFAALSGDTPDLKNKIGQLSGEFSMLSTDVRKADKGMARFLGQSSAAMLRIPIYAAGVTAMYAPIMALRDAFRQIIELDSQMTILSRVSSGLIDTQKAMQDSIDIAERLGNTIAEVNDGLVQFARQGYRGADLTAITEVATMMGNVSELNIEESASSLTAAMKAFNIEAENSIRIVDSLNEVNINQPPPIAI